MAGNDAPNAIGLVTQVVAVIAFYLYFGGWVYDNEILYWFGLSHVGIQTPIYFYIVYSYTVFFTTWRGWLLILAIASAWYSIGKMQRTSAGVVVVVVLATVPFPLIRLLALSRARARISSLRSGHAPPVTLNKAKAAELHYPEELSVASEMGQLWLAQQTEQRYYLFIQNPGEQHQLPDAKLYSLPVSDNSVVVTLQSVAESQ
jgi:hypothetical protein